MPIYVMKFIPYMYLALFVEHVVAQNDNNPSQNKQLYPNQYGIHMTFHSCERFSCGCKMVHKITLITQNGKQINKFSFYTHTL